MLRGSRPQRAALDEDVREDTLSQEELEAQRRAAELEAELELAAREAKRKEDEVRWRIIFGATLPSESAS